MDACISLGYHSQWITNMLDIKFIREHTEEVRQNIINRKASADVDGILELDEKRKNLQIEVDGLRQQLNAGSKQKPTPEEIQRLRSLSTGISSKESELKEVQQNLNEKLSWVPNMLSADVPVGKGEDDNVEVKAWTKDGYLSEDKLGKKDTSKAYMPKFDFAAKDHLDLGKTLDIIDVEQSAKVSGTRFAYIKNEGFLLEYALFELLKNKLIEEGFSPMIVPLLVKGKALFGSSHFPEEVDQVYKVDSKNVEEGEELYLVGSSEPSLFSYFMDKTILEKDLPKKVFAFTPCFRSEVGSWGKDVRGIKRVHQFDKLEMDTVTSEEKSEEMQQYLLGINEWLLQQLQIPYHVILMCSGDSGYAAAHKKYDVEAWLPSQQTFMEVMSDTNATDFQARRLNIKYQTTEGVKKYAHTVNDTGVAMGRMIIAILDNYQQADGSVKVPEVLCKYVGKDILKPEK